MFIAAVKNILFQVIEMESYFQISVLKNLLKAIWVSNLRDDLSFYYYYHNLSGFIYMAYSHFLYH